MGQSQTDLRRGYTAQPAAPVSRWAAEGRSASHLKIYPDLLEHPLPCLPQDGGGEGGGHREAQDSLPPPTNPKNIYFTKKFRPLHPNAFPSVADLSAAVFQDEPFKKLKPCFPFGRAESTSQLVFKLSLVKTISLLSPCPSSPRKREKAISNKYEKLVVSRSEDSS